MKLKKVLKYVDRYVTCRIWAGDSLDDEFKIVYEGATVHVPKKLKKNYRLVKAIENEDSEAMFPIDDGALRITIVKKEKKNGKRRNK